MSLLATAMWQLSPLVIMNKMFGIERLASPVRGAPGNPGVGVYKTKDDRFVAMMLLQGDRFWADWVTRLGRPDLADDPRFVEAGCTAENAAAAQKELDDAFSKLTLDELREAYEGFEGVWAPYQTLAELYEDPQVIANGYLPTADINGRAVPDGVVAGAVRRDAVRRHPRARARRAHRAGADRARLRLGPDRRHEGVGRDPLMGVIEDRDRGARPDAARAAPAARSARRRGGVGRVARTSGTLPRIDGRLTCVGVVGDTVSVDEAYEAAAVCAFNALCLLRDELGTLDRIERILSVTATWPARRVSTSSRR